MLRKSRPGVNDISLSDAEIITADGRIPIGDQKSFRIGSLLPLDREFRRVSQDFGHIARLLG